MKKVLKSFLEDKFALRSQFLSGLPGLEILELEKCSDARRLLVCHSTSANIPPPPYLTWPIVTFNIQQCFQFNEFNLFCWNFQMFMFNARFIEYQMPRQRKAVLHLLNCRQHCRPSIC